MFTTRLVSGIILVILALVLVTTGGGVLFAAVAAISLIGMFELYRAVKVQKQGEDTVSSSGISGGSSLLWICVV